MFYGDYIDNYDVECYNTLKNLCKICVYIYAEMNDTF